MARAAWILALAIGARIGAALLLAPRGVQPRSLDAAIHLLLGAPGHRKRAGEHHPEPATVAYSPHTCTKLFAYAASRDACERLQAELCDEDCEALLKDSNASVAGVNATECADVQSRICAVEGKATRAAPLKVNGTTDGARNSTVTLCNAYPGKSELSIQENKFYALPDPAPLLKGLAYLQCQQATLAVGTALNVYLGNLSAGKHVVGSQNAIVMIGQYKLGELAVGMAHFSFKDEGYARPIVCSAYPGTALDAAVVGRTWQPFAEATHPASLSYMECEMTAFDHADSLVEPEALLFTGCGKSKVFVDISPGHSLYIVGEKNKTLTYEQFSFGHLKTT